MIITKGCVSEDRKSIDIDYTLDTGETISTFTAYNLTDLREDDKDKTIGVTENTITIASSVFELSTYEDSVIILAITTTIGDVTNEYNFAIGDLTKFLSLYSSLAIDYVIKGEKGDATYYFIMEALVLALENNNYDRGLSFYEYLNDNYKYDFDEYTKTVGLKIINNAMCRW